jgi:hypothetical protein
MSNTTPWVKATASGSQGQCVEVRGNDGAVEVRDSKHGEKGARLSFTPQEWTAFLDGARKGEFDHFAG